MSNRELLLELGHEMAVAALEQALLGPDGEPAEHTYVLATYDRRHEMARDLAQLSVEELDGSYEDDDDDFWWPIERHLVERMGGEGRTSAVRRLAPRATRLPRICAPSDSTPSCSHEECPSSRDVQVRSEMH